MVNSKQKGNAFEREVCRILSLWWTHRQKGDVFWRTASSGALSTCSNKYETQLADITAVDPIGNPLIEQAIIEVKRGYDKKELYYILTMHDGWLYKTISDLLYLSVSHKKTFWLIWKPDRVDPLLFCPIKRLPIVKQYMITQINGTPILGAPFYQFLELNLPETLFTFPQLR